MIGSPIKLITYLYEQDKDKKFILEEYKEKRSLSQNAYAWVLIGQIAQKLHISKEEVYKKNIKEMGKYEVLPIKNEAVDTFIKAWSSKGIGWLCEILGESKIKNYTNVIAYYGSSIYDSKEMGVFLDGIIYECEQLEIPTKTKDEIERMNLI